MTDLSVKFGAGDEGELRVGVTVRNRDPFPEDVTSFTTEVWMNGRWFASATTAVQESVPANTTKKVALVLPLAFRREGRRAETAFLAFALRGELVLSRGGSQHRVPFQVKRRLEVQNAPAFTHEELR